MTTKNVLEAEAMKAIVNLNLKEGTQPNFIVKLHVTKIKIVSPFLEYGIHGVLVATENYLSIMKTRSHLERMVGVEMYLTIIQSLVKIKYKQIKKNKIQK